MVCCFLDCACALCAAPCCCIPSKLGLGCGIGCCSSHIGYACPACCWGVHAVMKKMNVFKEPEYTDYILPEEEETKDFCSKNDDRLVLIEGEDAEHARMDDDLVGLNPLNNNEPKKIGCSCDHHHHHCDEKTIFDEKSQNNDTKEEHGHDNGQKDTFAA